MKDNKFVWPNQTNSNNFPIFTLKTVPVISRVIKRSVCKPPVASLIATILNLSSTFYYPEITSMQYKAHINRITCCTPFVFSPTKQTNKSYLIYILGLLAVVIAFTIRHELKRFKLY